MTEAIYNHDTASINDGFTITREQAKVNKGVLEFYHRIINTAKQYPAGSASRELMFATINEGIASEIIRITGELPDELLSKQELTELSAFRIVKNIPEYAKNIGAYLEDRINKLSQKPADRSLFRDYAMAVKSARVLGDESLIIKAEGLMERICNV